VPDRPPPVGRNEPDPRRRARPTRALPGSPERIAEMELRARLGQPLRVAGDAVDDPARGIEARPDRPAHDREVLGERVERAVCTAVPTLHFGDRLRKARVLAGLTLSELARRSGVSRRQVRYLEAGRKRPKLDTILALAAALRCEPGRLLGAA
jgi:DNA-binding XRE family transcriptional regulator